MRSRSSIPISIDTKNNLPSYSKSNNIKAEYSDGLIETNPPKEIDKNIFEVRSRGITPGYQTITTTYLNSDPISKKVNVREEMASIIDIYPSSFTIEEGDYQDIRLIFDKSVPISQQPPKLVLSENLSIVSPLTLSSDRTSGVIKVLGSKVGFGTSRCYFCGNQKTFDSKTIMKEISNSVYQIIKTDLSLSDLVVINNYCNEYHIYPKENDLAIIKVMENEQIFAVRTYLYLQNSWISTNGRAQASNIILDEDLILAGEYNNIGNISKKKDGDVLNTKGMTLLDLIKLMFTKVMQPSVIKLPSITNFNHNQLEYLEYGSELNNILYGGNARFNQAEYSFNQKSNVSIIDTKVYRNSFLGKQLINTSSLNGTDELSTRLSEELSYIEYIAELSYSEDRTQLFDNLGNIATNNVNIPANTISAKTLKIQGYRKLFYGGLIDEISNDNIRALNSHNNSLVPNQLTININPGDKIVLIAFPKNTHTITKIINNTIMGTDVTDTFIKSSLMISGANNYQPIEYDIYSYTPINPFQYKTEFTVILGGDNHE